MEKLKNLDTKTKLLLGGFLVLGLLTLMMNFSKQETVVAAETQQTMGPSVDTFIPLGYTLLPIDLVNAESLNSLIGEMGGVVDLYQTTNDEKRRSIKVGTRVKLLRAPLNPQQFAVLLKEHESTRLASFSGPFLAVIQNPKAEAEGLTKAAGAKTKIQIEYQN
jgi:hypothetical protein